MSNENSPCQGCGEQDQCKTEPSQCSSDSSQQPPTQQPFNESPMLKLAMGRIRKKIVILSGKGGVGKSTVAVNIALALSAAGKQVGLLDVDIHGPSVPKLLNLHGQKTTADDNMIQPLRVGNLKAMSIGLLLEHPDQALIWRGPMKMSVIKQFLEQVDWGELDFLVIDAPPGTGDEPLSVAQLIGDDTAAVIVTTPQELAIVDVRKCITFCGKLGMPVLGVVENMSGFVCPSCGEEAAIFNSGGGERMATEMNVPFLGKIPLDPAIAQAGDAGEPYIQKYADSPTGKAFQQAIAPILA